MRKLLISIAILICSPVLFILALHILVPLREWLFPFDVWASSDCTQQQLAAVPAPEGRLEAQVFKIVCTAPLAGFFGNMADYTTIVLVESGNQPLLKDSVLDITSDWQTNELIPWASAVAWKGAHQLLITLPDQVSISRHKTTVAGVTTDARLVPLQTMVRQAP